MKFVLIAAFFLSLTPFELRAQSPSLRELETLRSQRDKAIEAATKPIQEKYVEALDALLQRTIKSGNVDAAALMKAELESAQGMLSPAFVIGVWKVVGPDGSYSLRILQPEGRAFFIGSDGRSFPNVWKIDGRKLIVGPQDDAAGRFTMAFTVDGLVMKGEGVNGEEKGYVATKAP